MARLICLSDAQIPLSKGNILLLSTDGIVDRFGGPEGKKFLNKRLRELLFRPSDRPMAAQHSALLEEFESLRGGDEQTGDVCVMGVRVGKVKSCRGHFFCVNLKQHDSALTRRVAC